MYIIAYINSIAIIYFAICNIMYIIKTQEWHLIEVCFGRKFPQHRLTAAWDVPLTRDAPCSFRLQSDPHPPVSPCRGSHAGDEHASVCYCMPRPTSTALTLNMKTYTNAQKFSSGFRWTESWCVCVSSEGK